MPAQVFRFKKNPNSLNPAEYGFISAEEIVNMSSREFLVFRERLADVVHRTRVDTAVWEKVIITPAMTIDLFRNGVGQPQKYASSDATYNQTKAHTNMPRKGEFPQGSLVIVGDIVARKAFTSGKATTVVAGIVTNPLATFPANIDPALILQTWTENVELAWRQDDVDIESDFLCKYPQNDGMSGAIGASQGGIMQNFGVAAMGLKQPVVLDGGDDFTVQLRPLAPFDASTASGIDMQIVQRIELITTEVRAVR